MTNNDGGIVVSLFLMAGAIAYAMLSAVAYYEKNSKNGGGPARLPRLCSGWANMGNSIVHVLLVAYMLSNSDNQSEYWVKERKLGGIEGPVFLALLNFAAGYLRFRLANDIFDRLECLRCCYWYISSRRLAALCRRGP